MIVLAEFQPLDTTAGVRKFLRAASANDPTVTGLNGVIWRPAISQEAEIGIRLFKGDFDGEAAPTGGSLSVQIDQWLSIEANVRKFLWAGAPIKLYAGVSGQAWPWAVVFDGLVEQFSAEKNTVKLTAKVNTEPFDADVLTLKYTGAGGAEGDTNLKDKVKPFLLGRCFSVEPTMINTVDNVLQFSGYGAIQAVSALYERGSDFGASIGNYASYAALVAATIPPGNWATCLAQGMVRLGAPPYGVITGDVDGDNVGGTWWRKTGEIIQRIASNSAVSGALIETASFTALDAALAGLSNQGRIGVYIDNQVTVLEIASQLAAPCNAQVGVSLVGKMFVGRIAIGSPSITLDAQQRQLPRVTSSVESSVSPPFSYLEMGYARAWRVHGDDEIAGFDPRLTIRYPESPPDVMIEGGIYIDATNKQFRYVGPVVTSDEGDITSDEGLVTSSGYEDIQDLAISAADAAAAAAIISAAAANALIANITSDSLLDKSEKPAIVQQYSAILNEQAGIDAQATAFGITTEKTAYDSSITALTSYLTGLSPAYNDYSTDTAIVRATFNSKFTDVYAARQVLLNKIADVAKARADLAVTNAAAAQATASAAIDRLDDIDDDGIITIDEKIRILIPEDAKLEGSYSALIASAAVASVSTTAAASARTAWQTVRNAISPPWNDTGFDSPVTRGTYDAALIAYDDALEELNTAIIEAMTAAKQVTATMASDKTVPADYTGAVTSDNLALLVWSPTVLRGGVNIRAEDDVHYTLSGTYGGTFAVIDTDANINKGNVSISAISASEAGGFLTPTVSGVDLPKLPFKVVKDIAGAPSAPAGTDSESWSSGDFISFDSASYVAILPVKTLALVSGQTLYGTAPTNYNVGGTGGVARQMTAKWQYSAAGAGIWNDFATGILGSTAVSADTSGYPEPVYEPPIPGYVAVTQSKSGLATGNWDVRMVALASSAGRTLNLYGSALMEAKT